MRNKKSVRFKRLYTNNFTERSTANKIFHTVDSIIIKYLIFNTNNILIFFLHWCNFLIKNNVFYFFIRNALQKNQPRRTQRPAELFIFRFSAPPTSSAVPCLNIVICRIISQHCLVFNYNLLLHYSSFNNFYWLVVSFFEQKQPATLNK